MPLPIYVAVRIIRGWTRSLWNLLWIAHMVVVLGFQTALIPGSHFCIWLALGIKFMALQIAQHVFCHWAIPEYSDALHCILKSSYTYIYHKYNQTSLWSLRGHLLTLPMCRPLSQVLEIHKNWVWGNKKIIWLTIIDVVIVFHINYRSVRKRSKGISPNLHNPLS